MLAKYMHFSSSEDKNPKLAAIPYYVVIDEIWVVDYVKIKFPIFKCKWVWFQSVQKLISGSLFVNRGGIPSDASIPLSYDVELT